MMPITAPITNRMAKQMSTIISTFHLAEQESLLA